MREVTRVLVADDNEDHRFLIVRALEGVEGSSLHVEQVANGEEALDRIYSRGQYEFMPRPHLVLLDLKMPRMSGLDVLERVKQDDDVRQIPIVVLTSSERSEDIDAAYKAGTNCYVTKPSNLSGLRSGLERVARFWTQLAALPQAADG